MLRALIACSGMFMLFNIGLPVMILPLMISSAKLDSLGWREGVRRFSRFVPLILLLDLCTVGIAWTISETPVPTCDPGYTVAGGGLFGGATHCVEGKPVTWKSP